MPGTTMRAVQFDRTGGPEVLQIRTLPVPTTRSGRVLVRVRATSVNPSDVISRHTHYTRFPRGTCSDFVGEVAEAGPKTGDLQPRQQVWGWLGPLSLMRSSGAAADYVEVDAGRVASGPATISLLEAAALPLVGLTALHALRHVVRLRPGQRLLIVGASGGVGSVAIQLARAMGAAVTAVSSSRNHQFCQELGADQVIDYATNTPVGPARRYDALLACHGADLRRYLGQVHRAGRAAVIPAQSFPFAVASCFTPGPRARISVARARRGDLEELARYVDSGALRPIIDRVYPLESIQDAHRAVESGHARGKRVIDLSGT